jgi:WD40 repeat protein
LASWTIETTGHRGEVKSVRYSPDGKWIASCADDETVRIWDAKTNLCKHILVGGSGGVAWSPDSKYVASGGPERTIRIWDPVAGRLVKTMGGMPELPYKVAFLDWSPDGKLLAVMGGHPTIWDVESGTLLHTLSGRPESTGTRATQLEWSPDGAILAFVASEGGYDSGSVRRWVRESNEYLDDLEQPQVVEVSWSPDGQHIISSDPNWKNQTSTYIWHHGTGQLVQRIEGRMHRPSPDGRLIATANGGKIQLYDAASFQVVQEMSADDDQGVCSLCWSPDSKRLTVGTYLGNLKTWNVDSGTLVMENSGHRGAIGRTVWSPDGTRLALVGRGIHIVDVATGEPLCRLNGGDRMAWSPDGKKVVSSSGFVSKKVVVWNAATGDSLWSVDTDGRHAVAWSSDGRWIATNGEEGVNVHDAVSGDSVRTCKFEQGEVYELSWSPNGKMLAGRDKDNITLWDSSSTQILRTIETRHNSACEAFAWSPDSTMLATLGNLGDIRLWAVETGKLLQTKQKLLSVGQNPSSVVWSDDGLGLQVGAGDLVAHWDMSSGSVRTVKALTGGPFSPDGAFVTHVSRWLSVFISDADTGIRSGTVAVLNENQPLSLSAAGHYRTSSIAARKIVYIVQTDSGQQLTLAPAEFEKQYGWKNDPGKVNLLMPGGSPAANETSTAEEPNEPK